MDRLDLAKQKNVNGQSWHVALFQEKRSVRRLYLRLQSHKNLKP